MKVAIWTQRFYPEIGGLEKSMKKLAEQLSNHGFHVDVLTTTLHSLDRINIISFDCENFIEYSSNYLRVNSCKYDIIYISRIFQNNEYAHLDAIRNIKFSGITILRIPTTSNIELIHKNDSSHIISKKIDLIISQNKSSLYLCRKYYKEIQCILSKNKVELPPKYSIPRNKTFLFAGRITESKNLYSLLLTWEYLNLIGFIEEKNIRLNIYGIPYDRKYYEMCMQKILTLKNVLFLGQYEMDDNSVLDNAYFTVIPSLREGHSNLALESLSYGTPIIASNIPGLREEMSQLQNYLIFNPTDIHELSKRIIDATNLTSKEYGNLVKKLRYHARKTCNQNSTQTSFFLTLQIHKEFDFSILIIKPEAVQFKNYIDVFLGEKGFSIIFKKKYSNYLDFVRTFYFDLSDTQVSSYLKWYDDNGFKKEFHAYLVQHCHKNSIQKLVKLKGPYSPEKDIRTTTTLRSKFRIHKNNNLIIENKHLIFNGFHCPRTLTELVHLSIFLNFNLNSICKIPV